ncbi:MAG: twin-arginine translocase TatA/TatE family subunit [Myxococcota bacterium]|jgi:sec-independent protein translocase protein TatA|nr:twin-arginine translocase TatA/TatE family subunit [Myxococcota bacterium]
MYAPTALLPVALFSLGPGELIFIAIVLIVLFGARRIPELGNAIGQGLRNFKKGLRQAEAEDANERKSITAQDAVELEESRSKAQHHDA